MADTKEKEEKVVYEVGYHIVPIVEEAEVPAQAAKLKSIIEENGGTLISDELPKNTVLAYEISKVIEAKKHEFNKAYFGWIKFEAEPAQIAVIKSKIESLTEVLRFLIIKTVRENLIHAPKIPMFRKENKEEKPEEHADKPKASEEEIDKSIDELVIN